MGSPRLSSLPSPNVFDPEHQQTAWDFLFSRKATALSFPFRLGRPLAFRSGSLDLVLVFLNDPGCGWINRDDRLFSYRISHGFLPHRTLDIVRPR
jgi:hypothetical protein